MPSVLYIANGFCREADKVGELRGMSELRFWNPMPWETRARGGLLFNNFDFEFDTPFADLLYLINDLERRGSGDRVLLSVDANWSFDEEGRIRHEAQKEHPETGKRTYVYMITHAAPMLLGAGVSLQRINRCLVENPRRLFEAFDERKGEEKC